MNYINKKRLYIAISCLLFVFGFLTFILGPSVLSSLLCESTSQVTLCPTFKAGLASVVLGLGFVASSFILLLLSFSGKLKK